jgi:hypothetical protein
MTVPTGLSAPAGSKLARVPCRRCRVVNTLYFDPANPAGYFMQSPAVVPDCLACGYSLAGAPVVEEVSA